MNKILATSVLIISYGLSQQDHYITGTVTDKENNPLVGANLNLKGTYLGSTTDELGNYMINVDETGKYNLLVSYIGYRSQEIEVYISEYEDIRDDILTNSFSDKLGIGDENTPDMDQTMLKAPFHKNINFTLEQDALETEQIVVSASKKKEKLIDAPITIAAVSEQSIRRNVGGDLGSVLKNVKGLDIYQVGNGRTAINARGFMSAFNSRFVSLIDGANYMEPTFSVAYGNTLPVFNEDIERIEIVYGPSSVLYGPNAHNGLMNVITKHPRDSEGMNYVVSSGSSNYFSQRLRYAKAYNRVGFKINMSMNRYSDWENPRVFGQDYNMDNTILSIDSSEVVIYYGNIEDDVPDSFNDSNDDGEWQYGEKMTVLNSDLERASNQYKIASMVYFNFLGNNELSFGHEYNFQHGYMPFDSGLNFIDYTVGSMWAKYSANNLFARLHWMRSSGTKYWNSDIVYNAMLRNSLNLESAIERSKIDNYVKTDVLGGDIQYNFDVSNVEFVSGFDFSIYRPNSDRNFLDDRGLDPRLNMPSFSSTMYLDTNSVGNDIEIDEYGTYLQMTLNPIEKLKFVGAVRLDKHSYFEHTISPRIALQWSKWRTGNLRLSYNRAFQTPSIFNLHGLQYFSGIQTGTYLPAIYNPSAFQYIILNMYDPRVQEQINNGEVITDDIIWFPINTVFYGNKDGFQIDGGKEIPPLGIETVDGIDFGFKNVFSNKLLLDVVVFYSRYENFISPLRMIHSFYPNTYPYIPEFPSHIGDESINNWTEKLTATFSYTATGVATNYGTDIALKYYHDENIQVGINGSFYGNIYYEDTDISATNSLSNVESDTTFNDTLNYFLNNMMKSYSFSPTELYYNAPTTKINFNISIDNFISSNLWTDISLNYVSKFDFVSGYHVGTEDLTRSSLSPNLIYKNEGQIGGNILINLKFKYFFNDNLSARLMLNNITNKDGPRILGTPRIIRNYLLDLNYSF